jgi:hypothetical protein
MGAAPVLRNAASWCSSLCASVSGAYNLPALIASGATCWDARERNRYRRGQI